MATKLQPYNKYNPIVYDYVNQLPEDWRLLPNIAIFHERIERGYINEELLSVTIGRGVIKQSDLDKKDSSTLDKSKYLLVYPDDLVYSMRFRQGASGYSNYKGIVSPACTVLKPRRGIKLNSRYYHYMFRTGFYKNYAERYAYGIADGQMPLRYTDFKRMYSIVPPLDIQNSIVEYLDKKNNEIDKFIRNKERLIELLVEEKKTRVFNAVTNGISKNKQLKQSNIKWLPEIPNKWRVKKLKYAVLKISGGITPSMDNLSFWSDGYIPWVTSKDMKSDIISNSEMKITKKALQQTSIKIIPVNSILLVVRSGILQHSLPACLNSIDITINQDLKAIIVNKNIFLPHYFRMLLKGIEANILHECRKAVATVESIEMSDFTNFLLPIPPIDEQNEIIEYINQAHEVINSAISKAQQEINSIKEYREALITDLVTGKRQLKHNSS